MCGSRHCTVDRSEMKRRVGDSRETEIGSVWGVGAWEREAQKGERGERGEREVGVGGVVCVH